MVVTWSVNDHVIITQVRGLAVESGEYFHRLSVEAKMALVWALASALIIAFSWAVPLFSQFSALLAVGCALAAACRGYQAYQRLLDAYYGIDSLTPVNLFIDEAAEVLNQPAIQLMNKGRGADFRVTIATQTFADFASRLGDENKARQVLANTNNKIALRVLDSETQKYLAEGMPQIKVRSMALRYGHNVDSHVQDEYTASYQEQIMAAEAEFFPAAMLGELPPLHFIARLSGGRTLKGRFPILLTQP
jgi:hypothetical protein